MINADKCFPSLAAGTWTSFCSVLMVDKFHSVVWSQSSWPQQNTLAFYRKCTHNKSKPFLVKPNLETSIRNREAQGSSSSTKWFDLSPQVHTQQGALSGSNFFPLTEKASHILLPVSQWKQRPEQEQFAPNWSASSVLALVWPTPVLATTKLVEISIGLPARASK